MTEINAEALSGIQKLLIINLGGIGDLLLSSGALTSLRETYPRTRFDILAAPRAEGFLRSYGLFDHVYPFNGTRNLRRTLSTLYELRRTRYDIAVNMRTIVSPGSAAKIRLLLSLVHPRLMAGWNTDGRGDFFDISIRESNPSNHPESYYHEEIVKRLGVVGTVAAIRVPVTTADDAGATDLICDAEVTGKPFFIGINPGAGTAARLWPSECFAELIRRLHSSLSCTIVLTGSPDERPLCARIATAAGTPGIIIAAGSTTVGQLAALIRRCHLYLSNDTGAMHLCTAVNTPGVYLFGPGNIERYRPFRNPERYTLIHHPQSCSPCDLPYCPSHRCMRAITVNEVYDAVLDLKRRIYDR